jgi:hypothetical protein
VLDAAGADQVAVVLADEAPPGVAEFGPAHLDAVDHGLRVLRRVGPAGDVAHDDRVAVQPMQRVEVAVVQRLKPQPWGDERGHDGDFETGRSHDSKVTFQIMKCACAALPQDFSLW